jgi:hypothetical protein
MTKKWKPKLEETFYYPDFNDKYWVGKGKWMDVGSLYMRGMVCKTEKEARDLAKKMYKLLKESQEKE